MSEKNRLMHYHSKEYKCTIELTLDVIGGKWKPIILWYLGKNDVMRFGELRRALAGVTQKMLTQQLRELETDSLIHRHVYTQVPPKVEYSLTPQGKTILPVLEQLCNWGDIFYHFVQHKEEESAAANPVGKVN